MDFIPMNKMLERIRLAREDSDTSLFFDLLYMGEMLMKLVAAGLVAAISDDRQRHRYRQLHRLVRADSPGDWSSAIEDILTGPTCEYLVSEAINEQRELTQRFNPGTWQYESVLRIQNCLKIIDPSCEDIGTKVDGKKWFSTFTRIRNKTRGHGAIQSNVCGKLCNDIENSIILIFENYCLFKRPWAYLHENLSGKYRVTKFNNDQDGLFDPLKSHRQGQKLLDGVFIHFKQPEPSRVELVISNEDASDFFFPNGGFNDKHFELISYISNNKSEGDSSQYLSPATELPPSETQGIGRLDVQGKCFGNLPPPQDGYISRSNLENELYSVLMDDHHPIITLVGGGGIGKTWTALTVLHKIANEERFSVILWFSARDIDLLSSGPKVVTPHVLTEKDIAKEYVNLIKPEFCKDKKFKADKCFAEALSKSSIGSILFVFDNFETVRSPLELFNWIDTYIRPPNKVLITTRFREFKGDYYIEVPGMTEQESEELIDVVAETFGISKYITTDYKKNIYQESYGHPYVIKIFLGEIRKQGEVIKVERVIASKDKILFALFDRTFSALSSVAKRVLFTLCNWRSTVPQIALEAVLLRRSNERMDISAAIDELWRSSFIEIAKSKEDGQLFISVPLAASIFGKGKLAVSPMKTAVEADTHILHSLGAGQQSDIQRGITPRIENLFRNIADKIVQSDEEHEKYVPILEYIACKHSPAWLLLASLYEEFGTEQDLENAKRALRSYLEISSDSVSQQEAWRRLSEIYSRSYDWVGEAHALVEMCELKNISFNMVSNNANRINILFRERDLVLDSDEKEIIVRRFVEVMRKRIDEGDATDCSRLAWLCLHLREEESAKKYINIGLAKDENNEYCLNLAKRLLIRNKHDDTTPYS